MTLCLIENIQMNLQISLKHLFLISTEIALLNG